MTITLHFFSDSKKEEPHTYNSDTNTLNVNSSKLVKEEFEKFSKEVTGAIDAEFTVIEDETTSRVHEIIEEEESAESQNILKFLSGKISGKDLQIVRAALYIRRRASKHETIDHLKLDLIKRYGQRGNNVSNLCSAGYFEEYVIPLYKILEDHFQNNDAALIEFQKIFDRLVDELPFTIFVSIKTRNLKEEIVKKLEVSKKYGLKFLNIHGIGQANVSKIQEVLSQIEQMESIKKIVKNTVVEKKNAVMYVRFDF